MQSGSARTKRPVVPIWVGSVINVGKRPIDNQMGFLDSLLGSGIDGKLKHLDKLVENASYDVAEESLLDLRGACARKY